MKVNLLFQYKRPEYIKNKLGKEWDYWKGSYFRYNIYEEQHNLLVHLENVFGTQALVLYAAAAIITIKELVELKKQRKIIENSNYRKASELTGHNRNTYIRAGTYSIACSEPERIDNFNIIKLLGNQQQTHNLTNKEFVIETQKKSIKAISKFKKYSSSYKSLMEEYKDVEDYQLFYSFLSMKVFSELTGIQWLIKTEA